MCVFRVKGTCFFFLVKSWHAKLALFILIDLVCCDFFFRFFSPTLFITRRVSAVAFSLLHANVEVSAF